MKLLYVIVLAGCVAVVASTSLRESGGGKNVAGQQVGGRSGSSQQQQAQSRIKQDASGVDTRFQGPKAKGGSIQYNFKKDFDSLINPRNVNADWRWGKTSGNSELVFSNASFVRDADKPDTVDLVSIPFRNYLPQDGTRVPPLIQYEAIVVHKNNFTVHKGNQLVANVQFACKVVNAEDQTSPKDVVSQPEDDPALGNCGFSVASNDQSALVFSIVATNKGYWAVYERNRFELLSHPERNQKEFTYFLRVADRHSPTEIIDAAIKYDRDQNRVDFMLNDEVVFSLTKLGTLNDVVKSSTGGGNPLDQEYSQVYTLNRPDLARVVEPKEFQVYITLGSFPDTTDPNSPGNPPLRGSKLTTDPNYYDQKAKFHDNDATRDNIHWGQGATMTLKSVQIKLEPRRDQDEPTSFFSGMGPRNNKQRAARKSPISAKKSDDEPEEQH